MRLAFILTTFHRSLESLSPQSIMLSSTYSIPPALTSVALFRKSDGIAL